MNHEEFATKLNEVIGAMEHPSQIELSASDYNHETQDEKAIRERLIRGWNKIGQWVSELRDEASRLDTESELTTADRALLARMDGLFDVVSEKTLRLISGSSMQN